MMTHAASGCCLYSHGERHVMSDYSEILYAELSTVEGVGRVIDMGGR
jgi:hypothetical protein